MNSSCKGYLSKADDGYWYLCQSPDVKSCCVQKQSNAIRLDGDYSSYSKKIPVEIINGQILTKQGVPYFTFSVALLGAILLLTYLKKKQRRSRSPPPLL